MSFDIRYLTNGEKSLYCITDSYHVPPKRSTYETLDDVPEPIRHLAKKRELTFIGPDVAGILGWDDIFYPEWKDYVCLHPCVLEHDRFNEKCIAESCGLCDYHNCPFLFKEQLAE
mgnify:CR=1 FL=1